MENSSPGERLLTPCPPPLSVTPTARQRRRHQREKREEELTQGDRNRCDEIGVVVLLEVDGASMFGTVFFVEKLYGRSKAKQSVHYEQ